MSIDFCAFVSIFVYSVYIDAHLCVFVYLCFFVRVSVFLRVFVSLCMFLCICVFIYAGLLVLVCICAWLCVSACVHVCAVFVDDHGNVISECAQGANVGSIHSNEWTEIEFCKDRDNILVSWRI